MRCKRGCYLLIIMICVCCVGYYTILSSPRAPFELDHWSYSEQQSAVKVDSFEYKQASARRSLLRNSNVQRYLLSLSYWEQHTMAMRNLFSLACFANLWNMSVIQPFTYNSRLYGLPNFKPGECSAVQCSVCKTCTLVVVLAPTSTLWLMYYQIMYMYM